MDEKLIRKRKNAKGVIYPCLGKIVHVTFRTGEGRKMRTGDFLISSVDEAVVRLEEVSWNDERQRPAPTGKSFAVDLEYIHSIVDGNYVTMPRRG